MSEEQNLRNYISELIQEIEKELEESTTTGNVDGYQTPHAFSRKKDKERRKKNATQLGYSLVDNDVDNISEAITKISSSNFKKLEAGIRKIDPKIKIYLDSSAPGGFEIKIPEDNKGKWVSSTDKINALVYKITGDQRNGRIFFEGKDFKRVKKDKYGNHLEPQFKKGDKVKYLGNKAVITRVNRESSGVYSYDVDYYKGNGRTKASNIFNKDGKTIQLESVNEGKFKPSQVRSAISRVKKQLMRKWKQKGGYENFGQKELRQLQNKFDYNAYGDKDEREISHMLDTFDNWAMNHDGNMREDINEAKVKRPVNRWLELKNDDTMHPHKKMAMGLKELKYQLAETEKFFNWYNKIKTMNELDSTNYWKRTQNHIYKIKERLINIAKTIQEIEK